MAFYWFTGREFLSLTFMYTHAHIHMGVFAYAHTHVFDWIVCKLMR